MAKKPKTFPDPKDGRPALVVREWAQEKHAALINYVAASAPARRKFNGFGRRTAFVDLYCGPGRCFVEESSEFIDGSPLAVARAASACGVPFSSIYINDENAGFVEACAERLRALGVDPIPNVGTAQKNISKIAETLPERGLSLAFVDPFNIVPFVTIEELAKLSHMDILVHVSLYDLNRNVFRLVQERNTRLESFAPGVLDHVEARTKAQVFNDVFEYWRGCVENTGLQIGARFKTVRGHNDSRYYWIVLASRSKLADKLWSSIIKSRECQLF